MLFNSLQYLVFFPVVVLIYYLISSDKRWIVLLAASYIFYMAWHPAYIILILLSTAIDYFAAIGIEKQTNRTRKKLFLFLSLGVNLGLLILFKYYNFFSISLSSLFIKTGIGITLPLTDLLLPVGISFYTFQTLSYSIDVYRGDRKAERHPGLFALYVAFFPQLVAGPIERSITLLPQLKKQAMATGNHFNPEKAADGLRLMLWGFFKKVVIADRLAVIVNSIYNNPYDHKGIILIVGTVFFAFQIFCDFSGYSDIAVGSARVLGIDLMENFKRPYFAVSVMDFWKRWHISLSSWFRDYVYIPLGGSRKKPSRVLFNIAVTFLISGLWHGANWTFVIWGALNGFYLIISRLTGTIRNRVVTLSGLTRVPALHRFIKIATTFCLICFAWIFFRAKTLSQALYIVQNIFNFTTAPEFFLQIGEQGILSFLTGPFFGLPRGQLIVVLVSIFILISVQFFRSKGSVNNYFKYKSMGVRWVATYSLLFFVITFSQFNDSQFIYFQF